MTPAEFAAKWRGVTTGERASAQSHFIDLCRLLGEPTPSDADPTGADYAFEKGAEKLGGGDGFADVWKRGQFAWEHKGKHKDLKAAYLQLVGYKDALANPPLLVVSDLERIEVHTNFTNLSPLVYTVTLDDASSGCPGVPSGPSTTRSAGPRSTSARRFCSKRLGGVVFGSCRAGSPC